MLSSCSRENRNKLRILYDTPITVAYGNRILRDLATRDLSPNGVYIKSAEKFPVGEKVDIQLHALDEITGQQQKLEGIIRRIDEFGMAIEFTSLELSGFTQLRTLIELHSRTPDLVKQEL